MKLENVEQAAWESGTFSGHIFKQGFSSYFAHQTKRTV